MFDSVSETIDSSALINFIFAMPFLIHPLIFGMFGKAMSNEGRMPKNMVGIFAVIGIIGVACALLFL